jgi:CHAT domain-containing protein
VGALWHVSDSQTAILTEDFYRLLLDKDGKLDFCNTARALHFAVRKIRDDASQRADDLVVWAPYIHMGVYDLANLVERTRRPFIP